MSRSALRSMFGLVVLGLAQLAFPQNVSSPPKAGPPLGTSEQPTISAIHFLPELQPLPDEDIHALLPFRTGEPLDPMKVREAIERLHQTGRYSQVDVLAERKDAGVELTIRTEGAWFVGRVTIEGVPEPPNSGQLISATQLELGREFYTEDLRRAVDNIRTKLEANGFFESRIDPKVDYQAHIEQVNIRFLIDPGPRAKITRPELTGLEPNLEDKAIRTTRWRRWWGLRGWHDVTERRITQGLERLRTGYAKNDHLLNRVTLNDMEYLASEQVARPKLTVNPGPEVRIRTEGAKVSRGKLRQLIPVYQEQSLDRDLLVEGMRNLVDYFQSRGYFETKVTFKTEDDPDGIQSVIYTIERGERYKLVDLTITGNKYFDLHTVRERMSVFPATAIRYRYGRFNDAMLRSDVGAIRDLYQSNGFLEVKVETNVERNYRGNDSDIAVAVKIEEGQQWLVDKFELTGVDQDRTSAVEPLISSVAGQPYTISGLVADRDNVLNYYYNLGYPEANFEWEATPADTPQRMNLSIRITEGQPQFVRGLLVGGLVDSDAGMVFERIRLSGGEPLSQARMVESQRRLYDLGVFARVDMAVQNPEGDEQSKYLLYQFEEARKYSLNFGFGAEIARIGGGTPNFDAPAGEPGFSPRVSVGLTRSNFWGMGHIGSIQTRVSNIQRRALITYIAPSFKGSQSVSLSVSGLYDVSRDIRTFEGRRREGTIQLSQRLSRANTLQTRFSYRQTSVANLAIDPALIPIYSRAARVGIVSATLFQDHRDSPVDSTRGYYNSLDVGLASKIFASQADFLRFLGRNSTYHRIGRDMVLARSSTIGWLMNLRSGGAAEIPLPERFFSGGAASHRGFPDNQAGPRDLITGFPLGGSAVLMNNVELRFPLYGDNLGGVIFHDAGNVYESFGDISFRVHQRDRRDFNYMVHAVGIGFRYRTPVGPVRVDFGFSANPTQFQYCRDTSPPLGVCPGPDTVNDRISRFQFHFSLGQTF